MEDQSQPGVKGQAVVEQQPRGRERCYRRYVTRVKLRERSYGRQVTGDKFRETSYGRQVTGGKFWERRSSGERKEFKSKAGCWYKAITDEKVSMSDPARRTFGIWNLRGRGRRNPGSWQYS